MKAGMATKSAKRHKKGKQTLRIQFLCLFVIFRGHPQPILVRVSSMFNPWPNIRG